MHGASRVLGPRGLVFGSKLVSYDAASLPFGMASEPRRRLGPTPAGGLLVFGCGKICLSGFGRFRHSFSSSSGSAATTVESVRLRTRLFKAKMECFGTSFYFLSLQRQ